MGRAFTTQRVPSEQQVGGTAHTVLPRKVPKGNLFHFQGGALPVWEKPWEASHVECVTCSSWTLSLLGHIKRN